MNIKKIQKELRDRNIDGWLLADFHGRNTLAKELMELGGMLTRRSFYFIPAKGDPICLANAIELDPFRDLPGELRPYSGYKAMEKNLAGLLSGVGRIAMEYSALGRLPYVGLVEAGTIELVRDMVGEIVPSADLISSLLARLSPEQITLHRQAATHVNEVRSLAHKFITESLISGRMIREYDVVTFMMDQFASRQMVTDHIPICAVNGNAGNGHYEPQPDSSAEIKNGQLVLIDLWAKLDLPSAVYADITWMAFTGTESDIPDKYHDIFAIVTAARDRAVSFLAEQDNSAAVRGADVDDACRAVIEKTGYGPQFSHRTGHSITGDVHGAGPNIDNLETEDSRVLQQDHLFSIEPGIYSSDYGFRSEIDCLITPGGPEVTTQPLQQKIVALL